MKTKKSLLNFLTDVIPLLIVSFLGIFKLKFFVQYLGDDTLGLYQLFSQIMVYISLVDGGLTSAVLYSLYKPNKNKDEKSISKIIAASKKTFSLIGALVFFLAFIVSFFAHYFIKDCTFSANYVGLTFILFSISNVINYFFVPYQVLLEVKEKKYITNLCVQIGQIILSVTEIIMLINGVNFISILLMHSIVKLIANIIQAIICHKVIKDIDYKEKEKDYSFTNQIKDLLVHKINGLIGSNIDVVIISSFMGLSWVAIYSVYYYIYNMIKTIIGKISGSIIAIVGNQSVNNNKRSYEIYKELNSFLFFVGISICVPLYLAINYFINIWYENAISTTNFIAICFSILLFVFTIKLPTTTYITSNGLFKETKKCATIDMLTNLILSLILVNFFGIPGVLLATIFSMFVSEYIYKTIILYKNVFKRDYMKYFVYNLKFFGVFVIDLIVGILIINQISIDSIITWFGIFIIYTTLNSLIILLVFNILKEAEFINRLKRLIKGD
ncbi:MAG: hypothetical protein J6B98_07065 [Bacilli bacterium]|nr:hypothetical protein [Bacilli bacterium]